MFHQYIYWSVCSSILPVFISSFSQIINFFFFKCIINQVLVTMLFFKKKKEIFRNILWEPYRKSKTCLHKHIVQDSIFSSQSQKMNCLNWVDELNASIWRKKPKTKQNRMCTKKMLNLFDADSFKMTHLYLQCI